ncbi:acetate/propionate family kinase [Winogradskyella aurantiaca]|uniref:acetate/propionate family kinase n=1 Tax=Winogradskyella aurantiaca TaxID=2219558 RepID=UPI000E1DA085|nr:acetate kinase [Winogradskyella aurantiaca]
MKLLVLNSGSSSLKYQVFSMPDEMVLCSGLVERIGLAESKFKHKSGTNILENSKGINDHGQALKHVVELLLDDQMGVVSSINEIKAVGHRVVHGGSSFKNTTVITEEVKKTIKSLFNLAPLHNPANLDGIKVAESVFPEALQVAVFDTAFHQTIPPKAYKYAIPNKFLEEQHIRLYGFHGSSHKFVSEQAINYLGLPNSKIITIHLGNGCSMTAIENGKSLDHSLGFSPVNGLIMGTRSGDIDHSLIFYLVNVLKYNLNDVNTLLQSNSGLVGLTGFSDMRDVQEEAEKGNLQCQLALDMTSYRIKKYIGAYTAAMNGLDAIVFTAGIGENSALVRQLVCEGLEYFGIELDPSKNIERTKEILEINRPGSLVKILIIPTNEELEIAKQTYALSKQRA